jgi:hypothetical protein
MKLKQCVMLLGIVEVSLAATGCGDCAGIGLSRVTPTSATLRVGESITLLYETGGGCATKNGVTNIHLQPAPTVWRTSDTLIVRLDTLTGRVTGRSPGLAQVRGGSAPEAVTITVAGQ